MLLFTISFAPAPLWFCHKEFPPFPVVATNFIEGFHKLLILMSGLKRSLGGSTCILSVSGDKVERLPPDTFIQHLLSL